VRRRLGEKLIATFETILQQQSTPAASGGSTKAKRLDEAYVYDAFPYDLTTGELKIVKPKHKPIKQVSMTGDRYSDVIDQLFGIINEQEQRISALEKKLLSRNE